MKKILLIGLIFLSFQLNAQINQYFQVKATAAAVDSGEFTVRFIDFDGTILKTELVDSFETATAPTTPTHEFLTFDEWNNRLDSIQSDMDIGATYETTDGHSYLFITLSSYTGDDPVIYLNKSTTDSLYIIDNATDVILGRSGSSGNINIDLSGKFAAYGDYVLRIECAGSYKFGNGNSSTSIFANGNYRYCLKNIYFGNNMILNNYSLYQCYSLTSITIPSGVTSITNNAFQYCYSLISITIPSGVTSIGNNAIQYCYSLGTITIPSGVTSIGNAVFNNCYSLGTITIPSGVTSIGINAFQNCYQITSITIPLGVTWLRSSLLNGCNSLGTITIPSGVTSIDASCLQACYSLTSITIPSGVTAIGESAFQNCYKVTEFIINATTPPTLANINAFTGMNLLAKIKVPAASVAAYKAATNWSDASIVNHIVAQ